MNASKRYIGDSVYVCVERGMFKLTTENGFGASNTIYLEPEVFDNFVQYARDWMNADVDSYVQDEVTE